MKLIEQLLGELGADAMKSITLVPASCCYLKNVKSVVDFSEQRIVLAMGKGRVTLEGVSMLLGGFFEGDLLVKGDVRVIKVE